MPKSDPPRWWSEPSAVSRYATAVSSVALAIVVAHLLTVFLHTEPIASAMMSAVMLAAWFGGFGPGLLAIALAVLAIHYYVTPPVNSFAPKGNLFSLEVAELPRLILFSIAALFIAFLSSAQRAAAQSLRRSRDDLLGALAHQKQIEGELRRSEMYLAEAQRLSQTGSFGWSVSSGEIFWSEESFRIFGYDKASSVTLDMVLQRVHPEDRALVRGTIERASSEGKDFDYEYRLLMPDGSVKHVHVVAHAVRDHVSQLEFIGALMDVTAAKQAGEELHKTQAELAHVTRVTTLGELTASIAHEVNQPLAAVVTNAEACLRWLGRETPNLDEARRAVEWIVKDGNRAAEVIRHVRALTNKTDTQKAPLDINDVVNEVIALVQRELLSQRVSLRAELAPALPVGPRRSGPAAAGDPQSGHERHRGDAAGHRPAAPARDPIGPRRSAPGPGSSGRLRRRDFRRERGPAVQRILHYQIRRHGHGTGDLPLDRRGTWGTDLGRQQCRAGRDVSVHSAGASGGRGRAVA